jgi:cell division protein FtsQ
VTDRTTGPRPPGGTVSQLPARLYAARLRARSRWRRLTATLTVFALLLAAAGYLVLWHTSLFAVDTVRVVGNHAVPAKQILSVAAIGDGSPLAALDTGAAARRVDTIPAVASASVRLDWPHTVVVSVVERVPAALLPVRAPGKGYQVVDSDGVVFATVSGATPGLPVISVTGGPAVRTAAVSGALAALRSLSPAIKSRITGISADDPFGITLRLSGDAQSHAATVNWGDGTDYVVKAADLAAMVKLYPKASDYDVSAPNAPALSP